MHLQLWWSVWPGKNAEAFRSNYLCINPSTLRLVVSISKKSLPLNQEIKARFSQNIISNYFWKVSIVSPIYYSGIYLEMTLAWFDMRWPRCFWSLAIQDPLNISFGNVDFQVFTPRDLGTWKQFFRGRSNPKPLILQTEKPEEIKALVSLFCLSLADIP